MTPWLKTLSAKILAGTSLAVLLTSFLTSFYLASVQRASLEKAFDKQSQAVASTIAVFSIEPLLTLDYPVLENALTVAGKANDTILFIEVMHRGVAIATYGKNTRAGRVFASEIRIHDGVAGKLGDVYAAFSTRDHDVLIEERLRVSAFATLIVFASFGIVLLWLLRRTVISPIQKLAQQTELTIEQALPELASADKTSRDHRDEIQQLGERFVILLNGLKLRETAREAAEIALLEHKNNLEGLVEKRTSALLEAQQEATRLNKNKSEFLAAASHDLRQPIQALSLFQYTLACSGLNEEQARLNRNAGTALSSLSEILNTLLDISKLDSGVVTAADCQFTAEELLSRVDDVFGVIATQKGLRFKLWFPFRSITLHTDANLLFGLLRNLIDNAIKYTPQGGILVSVRRRGSRALIQVWDTGIGIREEDYKGIFDEYVQISNPERDKAKGLGLGLSIVKRISVMLGCEVVCRSRPGRGSVFELSVPMLDSESDSETEVSVGSPSPNEPNDGNTAPFDFKGKKVLFIEDDALVAEAMRTGLEAQGMTVTHFADAENALTSKEIQGTDFVISDYWLPGRMNGMTLVSELRKRTGSAFCALLITGDSTAMLPAELKASGCHLLYKPVALPVLLSTLASLQAPRVR